MVYWRVIAWLVRRSLEDVIVALNLALEWRLGLLRDMMNCSRGEYIHIVRYAFCAALGRGEHCVRSLANRTTSPYAGCGGGIEITMGADMDQYARTEDEFGRDAGFRSGTKLREPQCCGNTAMAIAAANAMRRERADCILQHTVLKQTFEKIVISNSGRVL